MAKERLLIPTVLENINLKPEYKTEGASCMDLKANLNKTHYKIYGGQLNPDGSITIRPGGRALIPTGVRMAIEPGYEAQVRARSGLALKHGIGCTNGFGTIDSDYRGDIGIIVHNFGFKDFNILNGERLAQLAIVKVEKAKLVILKDFEELSTTKRGTGGFGSTNK